MLTHAEMSSIGERILQEYIDTFNIGSALDWARKLHYPHVRMAGGNVQIGDAPEAYAADNDKGIMRTGCAWGKTVLDRCEFIQGDDDKLHFSTRWSRYTTTGEHIITFDSFYIITKIDGSWGIQCRSSYAGIFANNTAF